MGRGKTTVNTNPTRASRWKNPYIFSKRPRGGTSRPSYKPHDSIDPNNVGYSDPNSNVYYPPGHPEAQQTGPNGMPLPPDREWYQYLPFFRQGYEDEMARYQTEYDRWMEEQARIYESPKETMGRLEEAGINPMVGYTTGAGAGADAGRTQATAPGDALSGDTGGAIQSIMSVLTGIAGINKTKAETIKTLHDAGISKTKGELDKYSLGYDKALRMNAPAMQLLQGDNVVANTAVQARTAQYKEYENKFAKVGLFRQDPLQYRMLYKVFLEAGIDPLDAADDLIEQFKREQRKPGQKYNYRDLMVPKAP